MVPILIAPLSPDTPGEPIRRYHRASLARLLARDGLTRDLATLYDGVRVRYAPPGPVWRRVSSFFGAN